MKVYLQTYGCRANQYDSEAVREMLSAAGVGETDDPRNAAFAIFNSCTVTTAAEADLRADVRSAKRKNPDIRSIVMGCAAGVSARDESISPLGTLPGVEAIVPGADLVALGLALGLEPGGLRRNEVGRQTGARALLRIQDGCDEHCTFCASTLARGANRSRREEELIQEASGLAAHHPEIVITGIHIGSYGRDIGSSLGELIEALIANIGRVRFRLSSLEATEVDERLASLLAASPTRLVPHLHAPLQSGSDRILRRMGRSWYDSASYEAAVRSVVGDRTVFALSADVIAGFPGETEADHAATMALVDRLPFTSLHVFPFSERPGTAATKLPGKVPDSVAGRRARELRRLAGVKAASYAESRVGGICDVVVTERGKGLTEDYLSVSLSDGSIPRRARVTARLGEQDGRLTAYPLSTNG